MSESRLELHFGVQDKVAQEHLSASEFLKASLGVVSDAIQLTYQSLMEMPFKGDKEDVVGSLGLDAVSSTIVAVRVALWGNLPEALGILRSSIERCAQLRFVVQEENYPTAAYEMERGFTQLDFKRVIPTLGTFGSKVNKLHGLISEHSAHATASRLRWNSYEREGQTFFRFGLARDPALAELPLFYSMDICMIVVDSIRLAYLQDGAEFRWQSDLDALANRFLPLKQSFSSRFQEPAT